MSHNEKRTHWAKEGAISLGTGVLYGLTNVVVGHPFDTIKTKMQAQKGYENISMIKTFSKVFGKEGIKGLYRGCVPPLMGSGIYRSIQFSAFEATYTVLDNPFGKMHVPLTHGIEFRVILGGLMAGTVRALVETPLEYAKIKRQTESTWKLRDSFTGLRITWLRSQFLLPSFFIFLDSFRRHLDGVFRSPFLGPFIASGCASVMAWWIVWPLEMIKSQIQAGYLEEKNLTVYQRIKYIVKKRGGFLSLYRGLAPGTVRSFIANGSAMVVMQYAQRKVTQWGLRD
ncbi:carnitine-acylcarnitine carrier [Brachionus plicatilis]|uniref:Carnitine-acylcarnitine carrier n=1 Tax=Brachionus plicatilis TaxID=10195 RepID=A0A3M7T7J5_BRAPC|nr:carnitine-acylcarnitine carrier [Brachionus plicatilis]